jgi:hypothetical protein
MRVSEFDRLLEEFVEKERELLIGKRASYAGDEDCLSNFKEIADGLGLDPVQVALVYLFKHVIGVRREVLGGDVDWSWTTESGGEGLMQRIADARNYLILLGALVQEKVEGAEVRLAAEGWQRLQFGEEGDRDG